MTVDYVRWSVSRCAHRIAERQMGSLVHVCDRVIV
jgi:hypothetical protein